MQAEEPVLPRRLHQNGMLGEFIVNKKSPYPNVAHSREVAVPPLCRESTAGCP